MESTDLPSDHVEPLARSAPARAANPRDPRPLRPIHHILGDPEVFALEVSDSRISVIEATIDPISSKLNFTLYCSFKNHVNKRTVTLYRSLDQIAWLHGELHRETPFIALGLPRSLLENQICLRTEAAALENLLETKRFQVERYFTRLLAREDICALEPWKVFISNAIEQYFISPIDQGIFERIKWVSLLFSQANKDELRPLPRIKAEAALDDNTLLEIDEFQQKRQLIRSVESSFIASHQGVVQLQISRESLGHNLSRLGDSLIGALHSRHRLGPLTKGENKYKFKRFDAQLETLATLFDDLNSIAYRQGQAEANKLGSVFEEYIDTVAALKACFNNCVDQWSAHLKQNPASLDHENKVARFKGGHAKLNREFASFNSFKTGDLKTVLKQFAKMQLKIERAKLSVLKSGFSSSVSISLSSPATSIGTPSSFLPT